MDRQVFWLVPFPTPSRSGREQWQKEYRKTIGTHSYGYSSGL